MKQQSNSQNKNSALSNPTDKKFVPGKEYWTFAIAGLGQGMIYSIMSSYISDFYISVMQLPLLFVLLLMLLARVWDAINDPLMGTIVDRHTTKWGKMKPYVLFTAAPIAILTFLMFFVPNLSGTQLMIYAAVVYILWGMIYTVSDVPFWSLPNVMTPNPEERAKIISTGRTMNGIGSAIPMALFLVLGFVLPKIYPELTGIDMSKRKYMWIAIVASVIGIVLFILSYFSVKERVVIPPKKKEKGAPSALSQIFHCKPLMLVILMGILSCGRYLVQAGAVHVARYGIYVGEPITDSMSLAEKTALMEKSVSTVSSIFMVCAAVGMFGAMLFIPMLYKRFNYKQIVIVSCLAGFVASIFTAVIGWKISLYACIPFIIIESIPLGVLNIVAYAMIGDSLDYMELKMGHRDTALGSACQSFVNKLGNAFATVLIVLVYMIIDLEPSKILSNVDVTVASNLASGQQFAIFSLVTIIPGISLLVCAIPMFFYDLVGEKKDRVTKELAEQRVARGIKIEED